MAISQPPGRDIVELIVEKWFGDGVHPNLEHRQIDELPLTRFSPVVHSRHHSHETGPGAEVVDVRVADSRWLVIFVASGECEARQWLEHRSQARIVTPRPRPAEPCVGKHDQVPVLPPRSTSYPTPNRSSTPGRLFSMTISRDSDQLLEDFDGLWPLQIQGYSELAAMEEVKIGGFFPVLAARLILGKEPGQQRLPRPGH